VRRHSQLPAVALIAACGAALLSRPAVRLEARHPQQDTPTVLPAAVADRQALLTKYCVTCHNQRLQTARLTLDRVDVANPATHADVWEKVIRKLRTRAMPPPGAPRPDPDTASALASWLESEIDRAAAATPNPGRTETFHRLNRAEYENAVRDLLAVDVDVTALLPPDDSSYGFDNIAGVLKISPTLLERYVAAARTIASVAVGSRDMPPNADTFRVRSDFSQRGVSMACRWARVAEQRSITPFRSMPNTSSRSRSVRRRPPIHISSSSVSTANGCDC